MASGVCALGYVPVLVVITAAGHWDALTLLRAAATRLLSSVLPYAADLTALRTLPPRLFSVLSSAQPALAALSGLLLLGQHLAVHEWAGIAVITATNVLAITSSTRTTTQSSTCAHQRSPNERSRSACRWPPAAARMHR